MTDTAFDPGGFYEFDLGRGTVRTQAGSRVVVLSDNVLAPLVSAAATQGDLTAVRRLGKQLGEQILGNVGGDVTVAPPARVLGHAAAVLGLFGWGRLGLERWGDALVATLTDMPVLDDAQLGVAALLGGIFTSLGGREVACVPVSGAKFLLVDPGIADHVWNWAQEGSSIAGIVDRLTQGDAA
jgi:hypothetical protein